MAASKTRRRTNPAPLNRERIGEAALAQIDAHGRVALSMRGLARDLGCEAMSLYHHVDGIEGVLDAVVDRLLDNVTDGSDVAGDAKKSLEAYANSYLALAEAHPNAFPLLAMRLLRTPKAVATAGAAVGLWRKLGLSRRAALRQTRILAAYLNGAGLALSAWHVSKNPDRGAQVAKNDRELSASARNIDAASVRADLDIGLRQILDGV